MARTDFGAWRVVGVVVTMHSPEIYKAYSVRSAISETATQVRRGLYRNGLKRAFDIVFALLAGLFVAPALLVLCAVIARDGHSPIYWSPRVGRGGRIFRMMKLRTMVHDADARLDAHLEADPEAASEWRATQKLKNDPRTTSLGLLLRKSSVDELPQLWNVLIGNMSVVGPRPMMPHQRSLYLGRAYYDLRPGLTGPWQVSDRNHCTFAKRAEYDERYDGALSLATDLGLIFRTVGVVLRGTGY